jgi:hypothetical protein
MATVFKIVLMTFLRGTPGESAKEVARLAAVGFGSRAIDYTQPTGFFAFYLKSSHRFLIASSSPALNFGIFIPSILF